MTKKKMLMAIVAGFTAVLMLVGCEQSDKVSSNISKDADNFKVPRQVTVINTRSDKVILQATGLMSVDRSEEKMTILIKTGKNEFKKHIVYENKWTAASIEQITSNKTNPYAYQYTINPKHIMHGWEVVKVENN
ncbi:hypothetical protein OfM1_19090 [Lactovum odontotermitis]